MDDRNRYGDDDWGAPGEGAWSERPGAFDGSPWGATPGSGGDPYSVPTPPGQYPAADPYGTGAGYSVEGDHTGAYAQGGYAPQGPAEPEAPAGGVTYPGDGAQGNRGGGGKIAAIVVGVLAVVAAGVGAGYFLGGGIGDSGTDETVASGRPPASESEGAASSTTTETRGRADGWTAPTGWNLCSGSGDPGDFNLAYAGNSVTSCPFTGAVRDAFVDHYLDTGDTGGTVRAHSTVTGKTYSMNCTDDGVVVTCRGGNNAVVHIV